MVAGRGVFDQYLKTKTAAKGAAHTHTRIGSKPLGIPGGVFTVPLQEQDKFLDKYYKHIWEEGNLEYLTEKQLVEKGPVLIDIDLRYLPEVNRRQHTTDHVLDAVILYAEKISEIMTIPDNTSMEVFVMEKRTVNQLDTATKDGIHIIFGVQMHKAIQCMLRKRILSELPDIWDDLPITNEWGDVLDEGVTRGTVNWQLYGSRKPGNDAYTLTHRYTLSYNDSWAMETDHNLDDITLTDILPRLSARYTEWPSYDVHESCEKEYNAAIKDFQVGGKKKLRTVQKQAPAKIDYVQYLALLRTNQAPIITGAQLDDMLSEMYDDVDACEYKLKETHQYTMCLPSSYYGPGSFLRWIRVGWALANTHPRMFLTWLKFSSQKSCRNSLRGADGEFDWNNVPDLYAQWRDFDFDNPDGLTNRSIMYWAREDARDEYEKVRSETIAFFIDQTVGTTTEFDLASVLYHIYKDRFVCVSIKNNCWYEYRNNRWYEIDSGNTLRLYISKDMHKLYILGIQDCTNRVQMMDMADERANDLRNRARKLAEIAVLLKKTNWKNNIMREARELFYDKDFMQKLDQNPYLLCFNNYVVDFKQKRHRKGQPDDYISKCTNIDYIPYEEKKHGSLREEIDGFMNQLFPNPELRHYMWEHLASCLIGTNDNQTFNMYTGSGRNGKSKLVDFMTKCLGDYKGTVPITLITQKRNSIGSTSSEIVQLMGVRYAVMQEPSKDDQINEGIMKEITGGDPIQGRALFKDTVTFIPQFKLVVCTNTLFNIKSNDDGTWRRIRVCGFEAKFLESPYEDDRFPMSEFPHQFKIDKRIEDRFGDWAPVFMGLLVKRAYKSGGNVGDCSIVMARSDEYRQGQDYLAGFVRDKIQKKVGARIRKQELHETFRAWYIMHHGRNVPKAQELYDYMNNRYAPYCKKKGVGDGWHNMAIIYDNDDDEEEEELEY